MQGISDSDQNQVYKRIEELDELHKESFNAYDFILGHRKMLLFYRDIIPLIDQHWDELPEFWQEEMDSTGASKAGNHLVGAIIVTVYSIHEFARTKGHQEKIPHYQKLIKEMRDCMFAHGKLYEHRIKSFSFIGEKYRELNEEVGSINNLLEETIRLIEFILDEYIEAQDIS